MYKLTKRGDMALHRSAKARARKRLDDRLTAFKKTGRFVPPPKGWVRAIRDALSMSGEQMASRMATNRQNIARLERSEAAGTIKIETLRRAADALDCTFVYALVPNTTLQDTLDKQARAIARKHLKRVAHSMELEGQKVTHLNIEDRLDMYARDHIRERDLWASRD